MERHRDGDEEEENPELQEARDSAVPRGWRPSEESLDEIQGPAESPRSPQDTPIQGDASDVKNLAPAFEQLEQTDSGQPIAQAIRDHGTTVKFGPTDDGAIAQFDPNVNEITIHENLRDASPAILAAHLAHEGTHVQWDKPDTIDQEYHAFKAEAEVWAALKGGETDIQCDWVSETIANGEDVAKEEFRRRYPGLPEY